MPRVRRCVTLCGVDGLFARLESDPAVAAFVADAMERAGGDAERAARWMYLRLGQGRAEDARVRVRVFVGALELVAAERAAVTGTHRPSAALRERARVLCTRSQALIERGAWLRRVHASAWLWASAAALGQSVPSRLLPAPATPECRRS